MIGHNTSTPTDNSVNQETAFWRKTAASDATLPLPDICVR